MKTPFTPNAEGIWLDLPAKEYHAAKYFSQSMAKHLSPPARLPVYLSEPSKETEFTRMGTLVHSRILTPNEPLPGIICPPAKYPAPSDSSLVKSKKCAVGDLLDWTYQAKFCRVWRETQEAAGLEVMDSKELDRLVGIVDAIRNHETAAAIFASGRGEVSLVSPFETAHGTIKTKCRLDWVPPGNFLADIKVVQDGKADHDEFVRLCIDRGYDIQAASNLMAWNYNNPDDQRHAFVFVAVERENPRPEFVNCLTVPPDMMELGRAKWGRACETYAKCNAENRWPGYPTGFTSMNLPPWAKMKEV